MTTFYYASGNSISIDIAGEMTRTIYAETIDNDFTSVDIGSTVTSLGDLCFENLTSLISVTIPSSVTSLGNGCFENCINLISVTIPSSVTSLGNACFSACHGLISVTIPSSVTSLGDEFFSYCYLLASVTIPSSVTSLGNECFNGCEGLTTIDIPFGVTSLGNLCFKGCFNLTTMIIPSSVNFLGNECFSGCGGLTTIDIPPFVNFLGDLCFENCDALTTIYIPPSITSLSPSCFAGCRSFTAITIPPNVTSLGNGCFINCVALTTITIPSTVEAIGSNCFSGCSKLITTIFEVGTSYIEISQGIFQYSFGNIPITQTVIFYNASSYTDISGTGLEVLVDSLSDYFTIGDSIPLPIFVYLPNTNTLASYDDGTYQYSDNNSYYNDISNNFTSIILGSTVTTISAGSLQNSNATSLILPSNIKTIDTGACVNSNLVNADISTVSNIGIGIFKDSTKLVKVIMPYDLTVIPSYTFSGCTSFSSYSTPTPTPVFSTSLSTMISPLTIVTTSFGEVYDSSITAAFASGTISIDKFAFTGTSLYTVIIPSSVTTIGENSFSSIPTLNTIVFENGRKKINFGNKLFWNISLSVKVKFYNVSNYFDLSLEFRKLVNDVTTRSYQYFNTPYVTFLYMSAKVPISIPVLRVSGLPDFYNNKSKKLTIKKIKKNLSKNLSK